MDYVFVSLAVQCVEFLYTEKSHCEIDVFIVILTVSCCVALVLSFNKCTCEHQTPYSNYYVCYNEIRTCCMHAWLQ